MGNAGVRMGLQFLIGGQYWSYWESDIWTKFSKKVKEWYMQMSLGRMMWTEGIARGKTEVGIEAGLLEENKRSHSGGWWEVRSLAEWLGLESFRVLWSCRYREKWNDIDGLQQWSETGSDLQCKGITHCYAKSWWNGARAESGTPI